MKLHLYCWTIANRYFQVTRPLLGPVIYQINAIILFQCDNLNIGIVRFVKCNIILKHFNPKGHILFYSRFCYLLNLSILFFTEMAKVMVW